MTFEAFPKVPRLMRDITITEKIDGTNAQIYIWRPLSLPLPDWAKQSAISEADGPGTGLNKLVMFAGSRKRWVTPDDDHFGFARWAQDNSDDLFCLGEGRHFGEWWGQGIQRKYGLDEKRFSLFNTWRWNPSEVEAASLPPRPECCHVVPVLYEGPFTTYYINATANDLRDVGSYAAPSFINPEGIMIWHHASRQSFKWTFNGDGHKG